MNNKVENHLADLKGLLIGTVKPRHIVGTGYKSPKSVASAWLRKEIYNIENPNDSVDFIGVTTSGKAYQTEQQAINSKVYQSLINQEFKSINNSVVTDFGVMLSRFGDGYEIYACLN